MLHGLILGMVLVIVAGGLTIIFGMLDVLNQRGAAVHREVRKRKDIQGNTAPASRSCVALFL